MTLQRAEWQRAADETPGVPPEILDVITAQLARLQSS